MEREWWRCIPDEVKGRACGRDGCTGRYVQQDVPHFDADGHALVGLVCSNESCGMQSAGYWLWDGCGPYTGNKPDAHHPEGLCTCLLSCGHPPVAQGVGTGVVRLAEPVDVTDEWGRTYIWAEAGTEPTCCYDCADRVERQLLKTADRMFGYLAGDEKTITTWSGGLLMRVTDLHRSKPTYGPYGSHSRVYVRATDVHGANWYGMGPNENGTYVRMRRKADGTKNRRRKLGVGTP